MSTENLQKILLFMSGDDLREKLRISLSKTKESPMHMSIAFMAQLESYSKEKRVPEIMSFYNGCLFALAILNSEEQYKSLFDSNFKRILGDIPDNVIPISKGKKRGVTPNDRSHA